MRSFTIYPAKITCLKSTIETLEKGVKYVQKLTVETLEWRQLQNCLLWMSKC